MRDTLQTLAPSIAGVTGSGLLQVTQHDISTVGQLLIVLATVITQLISIFKKKKTT